MERLDKVIGSQTNYSRKDIKELVKKKKMLSNLSTALTNVPGFSSP